MSSKTLSDALSSWDGNSTDHINEIYSDHAEAEQFIEQILACFIVPSLQSGATWLLKKHLTEKPPLDEPRAITIYSGARRMESWQSRLHILQLIPLLPIPESEKHTVEQFLRDCLLDHNKFVRAWAYSGFYELATQYAEYKPEVLHFIQLAEDDEPASVQARIRQIKKTDPDFFITDHEGEQ
ncbi:MAG: hypothetical protein KUG72_05190 [Pseudomonadales bacterium]|nr:hypothetical protein [Pseudomonadales bacterium]